MASWCIVATSSVSVNLATKIFNNTIICKSHLVDHSEMKSSLVLKWNKSELINQIWWNWASRQSRLGSQEKAVRCQEISKWNHEISKFSAWAISEFMSPRVQFHTLFTMTERRQHEPLVSTRRAREEHA